jgi:hypothetical protein
MSLRNLNEWTIIAKEAFNGSFLVAKALCFLHVTKTYVFTVASVSINKHKGMLFICLFKYLSIDGGVAALWTKYAPYL